MTKADLEKLFSLYDENTKIAEQLDDNIKTQMERFKENELKVIREDNREKGIAERFLWEEVRLLGRYNHSGAKALQAKYPEIWKLFNKEDSKVTEILEFEQKIFGFTHKNLTLPNYIKLTRDLIRLELDNK